MNDLNEWAYAKNQKLQKELKKSKSVDFLLEEYPLQNKKASSIEAASDNYENDLERRMNEISDFAPYSKTSNFVMIPKFDDSNSEDGVINASGS